LTTPLITSAAKTIHKRLHRAMLDTSLEQDLDVSMVDLRHLVEAACEGLNDPKVSWALAVLAGVSAAPEVLRMTGMPPALDADAEAEDPGSELPGAGIPGAQPAPSPRGGAIDVGAGVPEQQSHRQGQGAA
jgi:hypothetical protein